MKDQNRKEIAMAFFDKLSKSVTEASQKTIAKTKELADTSRLNSMISEQEKIITNQYFEIGKLYVSLHKEDYEEDFAGMMSRIVEAETKIQECRKEIQHIKGIWHCEKCGAEIPDGAAFCSSCGAVIPKVQVIEPIDYIRCENCGASVKKGMNFCTSCGKAIEVPVLSVSELEITESVSEKTCPNCSAKVDKDLTFCTECGTKLSDK